MNRLLRLLAIGILFYPHFLIGQNYCNTQVALEANFASMGSPLNGPYQPGEFVNFCFTIEDWTKNNCNWLHGVVPEFGNGWDEASFNSQGEPKNMSLRLDNHTNGSWSWFPENWVTYKAISPAKNLTPGDKVGAGWFFLNFAQNSINPFDPNFTWGDDESCEENDNQWEVCFTLIAREISQCEGFTDCSVSITTFGDGETGSKPIVGCTDDSSIVFDAELDCCSAATVTPINNLIICGYDEVNIPLEADKPGTTFTWTATAFNVEGAYNGEGTVIQQTLIPEMTGIEAFVNYSVVPFVDECEGVPFEFTVSISNPALNVGEDEYICSGNSVKIGDFPTNGQSPYTYEWSHGPTNYRPTVSPNQTTNYSLTVTDAFGCTAVDDITVYVGQAGPITASGNPCDQNIVNYSVPSFPGSLGYYWSVPNGATLLAGQGSQSISVDWGNSNGGDICVTLQSGCSSGLQPNCLDVIVGEPITTNGLLGDELVCTNELTQFYSVIGIQPEYTYDWNITNGVILSDPTDIFVEVQWQDGISAGEISVIISNGCNFKTETTTTTFVEPTVYSLSGPSVICEEQVTTYSVENVNPGFPLQFEWTVTPPAIILATNGQEAIVQWGDASNGQIAVEVIGGCDSEITTLEVSTFNANGIQITGNAEACQGQLQTYGLSTEVATTTDVQWVVPSNAQLLSDPFSPTIDINWTNDLGGIIAAYVTDCNGETTTSTLDVSITESSVTEMSVTLCPGVCYSFAAAQYCEQGIYIIEGISTGGCPEIFELTVVVLSQPDVEAQAGDDTTVGCTVDRVLDASASTIPPTAEFVWRNEMGIVVGEELTLTVSEPGIYVFEVYNPETQCFDSDEVVVSPAAPPVSDAGLDQTINCFNNFMITIGPEVTEDLEYSWMGPNGFTSNDPNPTATEAGIYILSVNDAATGCGSDSDEMEVRDFYDLQITAAQSICDALDGSITVAAEGIEQANYAWSNGATGATATDLAPGNYTVTISSPLGSCTEVLSAEVTPDLSCKVLIAGNVLDDGEEGDCIEGNGTIALANIPVTIEPLNLTVLTDEDGYYEFIVDTGAYELTVEVPEPYFVLCPGFLVNEVVLSDTSDVSLDNHFFLDYATNFDLFVTGFATTPKAGADQKYQVTYCNNFVQTINGKMEFIHDENVTFDPVENGATSYDPVARKATWLFAGLSFFECEYLNFKVQVNPGVSPGTVVESTVIGRPILGDVSPDNNIVEFAKTVPSNNEPPSNYVETTDQWEAGFTAYPNPSDRFVTIEVPTTSAEPYQLSIYDVKGAMVYRVKNVAPGSQIELDVKRHLKGSGLVLLKLDAVDGKQLTKRIMIQ